MDNHLDQEITETGELDRHLVEFAQLLRSVGLQISSSEIFDAAALNRALDVAQLRREIDSMEEGVQTLVHPMGANLSGGQRQRMSIARAVYRNSPILLFDEATSHLDMSTESELNKAIKHLPVTIISIAHRAETIRAATREIKMTEFRP